MDCGDDAFRLVPRPQSSANPSLRFGNTLKNREKCLGIDDDDGSSSGEESSQTSQWSGSGAASLQHSASEKQGLSKEWMFQGSVSFDVALLRDVIDISDEINQNYQETLTLRDAFDGQIPDVIRQKYQETFGPELMSTFSQHAPVAIDYVVIYSDVGQVRWGDESVVVHVRGYVAAATRTTRQAWEESIQWFDKDEVKSLSWTKVTGGILCWPQYLQDGRDSNNRTRTVDFLAKWGKRRYFDGQGTAWIFWGRIELPSRTAEHSDVLRGFPCCCRPSERVAPWHHVPCGALRNFENDEHG